MTWRSITFECELLEDLHCGSGTGRLGMIDDQHARNANDEPVVWWSALAGLLRDAADDLHALLPSQATLPRIRGLFGAEGDNGRSALVARSLQFNRRTKPLDGDSELPDYVEVTSTAREVYSRRPLDETLRTIELAAAGLAADGELRFQGNQQDEDFLKLCLQRLASLGGGKTKGMGVIEVRNITTRQLTLVNQFGKQPPAGPCRLRMLLCNIEPLCLAATGVPGNIIESLNYLPGQTLRGAWFTGLSQLGLRQAEVDAFAVRDVQFGNGYFVDPPGGDLSSVGSLPVPLSAEEKKPTERKGDPDVPWWSQETEQHAWPGEYERDQFQPSVRQQRRADAGPDKEKYKRIKAEDYLVTTGDGVFRRVHPKQRLLMRNGTAVARVERSRFDSRRPTADQDPGRIKKDGDLFTQTVLVEGQRFIADIRFETPALAAKFAALAAPFFEGTKRMTASGCAGGVPFLSKTTFGWMTALNSLKGSTMTVQNSR